MLFPNLRIPVPSLCDMYKTGHHEQYPKGTTVITDNFTPRKSRIPELDKVVVWGPRIYIRTFLMGLWKDIIENKRYDQVEEYEREVAIALNNPKYKADHLRNLITLGHLPLEIRCLPEGDKVGMRVPFLTIRNTHKDFSWLPNFLETQMSAEIWHPCTSATIAAKYRQVFDEYATQCGADEHIVPFQGHDFSMRGMTDCWSAAKSGSGHLLSFLGTDTLPAIILLRNLFNMEPTDFIGGSVPATEHSVMCAGGTDLETFNRLLDIYPTGIVSVVSDTWDFWSVIQNILPQLKDKIESRDGTLVIRPDSGDPVMILTGDYSSPDPMERKGLVEALWDIFGGTINPHGFKQLSSKIGAIYGDSITLQRQKKILERLLDKGFASTNVVLGIGSYTYQYITRDTFGFALKATHAVIDGKDVPLYKAPKTDDGTKNSAKGLVYVYQENEEYKLKENVSWTEFESDSNCLRVVFKDGEEHNLQTLGDVRTRVKKK